jgi:hypothetical protein
VDLTPAQGISNKSPECISKTHTHKINKNHSIDNGHIRGELGDTHKSDCQVSVQFKGNAISIEIETSFDVVDHILIEIFEDFSKAWEFEGFFVYVNESDCKGKATVENFLDDLGVAETDFKVVVHDYEFVAEVETDDNGNYIGNGKRSNHLLT